AVAGGAGAGGGLGLGDLVLVVGENEVGSAGVEVEIVAQEAARHGRALDVPTGPTRAPGRVPMGLAWLGALPQGEVERVALGLVRLDPGAAAHLVGVTARQPAVVLVGADGEVDVAAGLIGHPLVDEDLDQILHPGDVLGGPGLDVGIGSPQASIALAEPLLHLGGIGGDVLAGLGRLFDDLVLDVGDVADEGDVVTL